MTAVSPADFFSGQVAKPRAEEPASPEAEQAPDSPISMRIAASSAEQPTAAVVAPSTPATDSAALAEPAPAPAPSAAPLTKEAKEAERRRKAESKEEEKAIKEVQRKAREEAKAAKAAEVALERERKLAEKVLREAAAEETRLSKKAETDLKEAERKAKLEEKEKERVRKVLLYIYTGQLGTPNRRRVHAPSMLSDTRRCAHCLLPTHLQPPPTTAPADWSFHHRCILFYVSINVSFSLSLSL